MCNAGTFLRSVREHHGITQAELARRSYTKQSYISKLERGVTSPTVRTLERLVSVMGDHLVLDRDAS